MDEWSTARRWAAALARTRGVAGLTAGLVVPLGALCEPLLRGSFWLPELLPWPTRVSELLGGLMLCVFGLVLGARVISRWKGRDRGAYPAGRALVDARGGDRL